MQTITTAYLNAFDSIGVRNEVRLTAGDDTIDVSHIYSMSEENTLFQKLGIGNVVSRRFTCSLWNVGDIDFSNPITPEYRAVGESVNYPWLPKGTFFVDTINTDPFTQNTEITAYDSLLKADVPYFRSGTWTSKSALAVVQDIATDIGVTLNEDTETLLTDNPQTIPFIPVMGDNATTEREMLSYIGIMYCGNWFLNDNNELTLAVLGATYGVTPSIQSYDDFTMYNTETIVGVRFWTDSDTYYYEPHSLSIEEWEALEGAKIDVDCPYADQGLVEEIFTSLYDFTFLPYEATSVYLHPAFELGDTIKLVRNLTTYTSVIVNQTFTFDGLCRSELSAPATETLNSVYPYLTPQEREAARESANTKTQLSVLNGEITAEVSRATAAEQSDNLVIPQEGLSHNGALFLDTKVNSRDLIAGNFLTFTFEVKSDEDTTIDVYPRYADAAISSRHFFPIQIVATDDYYSVSIACDCTALADSSDVVYWNVRSNASVSGGSATANVWTRNQRLVVNGTVSETYSTLKQTADELTSEVGSINSVIDPSTGGVLYKNKLSTEFRQTPEYARITQIEGDINDHAAQQEQYIQYGNGTLTLGQSTNKASAELTNSSLTFNNANGVPKVIVAEDTTIPNLNCDTLQMGNFRWITRSNGHYSLKKV